jgi:acetyl-CoA C-acetyltransferase
MVEFLPTMSDHGVFGDKQNASKGDRMSSYIVAGCRTPLGKFLGGLASLRAVQLGGHALSATIESAKVDPESIDHVMMGQVIQAGSGQSPARQASTLAAIPSSVGAVTVNKVCGSGLYSVMMADVAIRTGEYQRVLAGGMESMSQAPHVLRNTRAGWKYGEQPMLDAIDIDGLRCAQLGVAMGCIAEWVSQSAQVTRGDQDEWAVQSHRRAVAAIDSGHFSDEIIPITVTEAKKASIVSVDEGPRRDCTLDGLSKLKPAFVSRLVASDGDSSYAGTVTAGNASTLSDGAAAVLVVDDSFYQQRSTDWAFRIAGHCTYAGDHQRIFTAPVGAVEKLLHKTRCRLEDIDLFEINEAFAAQTLACIRELKLDPGKVNIHGGAIALGHPLGCSGTRVLVSLIYNLVAKGLSRGIATLCLGGGEAVALMVERAD